MPEMPRDPESDNPSAAPESVEGLFLRAIQKSDWAERKRLLDDECPDDECRRRVEALLNAYEDSGSFLDNPRVGSRGTSETAVAGSPSLRPPRPTTLSMETRSGSLATLRPSESIVSTITTPQVFRPPVTGNISSG